jgi:hypothetical protein
MVRLIHLIAVLVAAFYSRPGEQREALFSHPDNNLCPVQRPQPNFDGFPATWEPTYFTIFFFGIPAYFIFQGFH